MLPVDVRRLNDLGNKLWLSFDMAVAVSSGAPTQGVRKILVRRGAHRVRFVLFVVVHPLATCSIYRRLGDGEGSLHAANVATSTRCEYSHGLLRDDYLIFEFYRVRMPGRYARR